MKIENAFAVSLPPDEALRVLTDVPRIAPCLPGVALTGTEGADTYLGTASVRLGPVALSFAGKARIEAIDTAARTARVVAEGADQKGRGRASATVDFRIDEDPAGARVSVTSNLDLSGAVAQYGRASGLIEQVANQIIAQFTRNLEADLRTAAPATAADAADGDQPANDTPDAGRDAAVPISGLSLGLRALLGWIKALLRPRQG